MPTLPRIVVNFLVFPEKLSPLRVCRLAADLVITAVALACARPCPWLVRGRAAGGWLDVRCGRVMVGSVQIGLLARLANSVVEATSYWSVVDNGSAVDNC